jgi:hypothetical protein
VNSVFNAILIIDPANKTKMKISSRPGTPVFMDI